MRNFRNSLVLGVGLLGFSTALTSQGALAPIASWTFPTTPIGASPISANTGTGSLITGMAFATVAGVSDYAINFTTSGEFTLSVSGTGQSGFTITYSGKKTSGNGNQIWSYSTDGSSFTALPTQPGSLGQNVWASYTVDFSGITALNGASSVYFRNTLGNKDTIFDNIVVSAVPEPVNVALAVFGLSAVGVGAGRRLYARRKA